MSLCLPLKGETRIVRPNGSLGIDHGYIPVGQKDVNAAGDWTTTPTFVVAALPVDGGGVDVERVDA